MKVAMCAIIGRPNVGKSTLINRLVNYDVSIVSKTPQTTRDQIVGIFNDEDSQIVFMDTPGIHKPLNKLGEKLNDNAYSALEDIDFVFFLTPVNEQLGQGDKIILEKISNIKHKMVLHTKSDLKFNKDEYNKKIIELAKYGFDNQKIISQDDASIQEDLINIVKQYSYDSPPLYDVDNITDKSLRFIAKEIIREACFVYLKDEIPHSIAVDINEFIENNTVFDLQATIYVKKDSQKGIVIGNEGSMIKKIGSYARKKMQKQFNIGVRLKTKVKVAKKWNNDLQLLKKLGY
ncbi:GTPase Era [Mycoplasma sp. Mirounga ES2805-ORL]|uniref:GTPase Era n=1 Tax=Mycoplasma sp. Mirounga ES2805-ORL TaxID=754514 RepID=UPI00197C3386|nr:GTPase Era [Mycoplasma sp. Mirounga ES2805-ORL]QSF13472.1 GTPase Era [Mycoplasma sp. Mirounga ES2805-ORL]